MTTVLIFIGIAIILYFINFNSERRKDTQELQERGGMLVKYEVLISGLNEILGCEVTNVTENSVLLTHYWSHLNPLNGLEVITGIELNVTYQFDGVIVQMLLNDGIKGKKTYSWEFRERNVTQEQMLFKIDQDIQSGIAGFNAN